MNPTLSLLLSKSKQGGPCRRNSNHIALLRNRRPRQHLAGCFLNTTATPTTTATTTTITSRSFLTTTTTATRNTLRSNLLLRKRPQQPSHNSRTNHNHGVLNPTSFFRSNGRIGVNSRYHYNYPLRNSSSRFFSALVPHDDDDDDDDHDNDEFFMDEEIERLAASSMGDYVVDLDDFDSTRQQQQLEEQRLRMEHSSLDLELGDTSVWDSSSSDSSNNPLTIPIPTTTAGAAAAAEDGEALVEEEDEDEVIANMLQFPQFPEGSAAAELHRQQLQDANYNPKRYTPALSPLAMLERVSSLPADADPLSYTGPPQSPSSAANIYTNTNDQPQQQDMEQLQLQLECEAQREAVQKYQALTDQTRSRKDYASLSSLQKLILHWYQPVRNEIEAIQHQYILKKVRKPKVENDTIDDESTDETTATPEKKKNVAAPTSLHRYGPLINTVDPEKLAVIATHEALTLSIMISNESNNHHGGCPVVLLAQKLGKAVEDEVLLQRVLKQKMEADRLKEEQEGRNKKRASTSSTIDDSHAVIKFANDTLRPDGDGDGDAGPTNSIDSSAASKSYAYSETRLNSYLTQIAGDGASSNASPKNRRNIAYAISKARVLLDTAEWTVEDRVQLGSILIKILLEHATIRLPDGTVQPAFRIERRYNMGGRGRRANNFHPSFTKKTKAPRYKASNTFMVHDSLLKLAVADEFESIAATTTRYKPMVVPPNPWTSPEHGGYAWLKTDLIRFHGSQMQREALDMADLTTVLDGLNSLSSEAWNINKTILNVAQECWKENIALGDIPSQTNLIVPEEPTPPERTIFGSPENPEGDDEHVKIQKQQWSKEYRSFKEARNRHRRVQQKNRDMFSLRCSAMLKLGQAEQFKEYEKIYFPYNMDFRGRAYPVPPHMSNVGSDLCRGMLKFAKAKPLGKRGLFWLEVHLANLAGKDKMTFDQRAKYSRDNIENIRNSVADPFGRKKMNKSQENSDDDPENDSEEERPWWMGLDDPFQGLATCHEIINALDSGNPETYMCNLPVHMDGSCNGLQHYAALGLDTVGGTAVNLTNEKEPQDVYIGVMEEVIRRVAAEAQRDLDFDDESLGEGEELSKVQRKELAQNRSAKLVNGLIDRGVVKRTVMTSVYGVTYIGARQQIQEKIEEKLEEQGRDLDEINYEIFRSSGYMAEITMNVIGDLFTGAKDTMNWLTQCARLLSAKGYPVAWMTPLGLPAIQPYRQKRASRIVTALNSMVVADYSDDLPIHKSRSVSAFPPNYIHSLDSTHMLMTALEMDRRGLSFSAVHDSFWTHPCDVDEMNDALRDMFVELYSQPLLEELKQSFELRYPDINFPDLPEKGDLDLSEVRDSTFFFQ